MGSLFSSSRSLAALLLVSIVLNACAGGGVSLTPAHGTRPTATPTATMLPPGAIEQNGTVALPSGVGIAASSLTVTNSVGAAVPNASGAFTIGAYAGGPQFATVSDAKGNVVLAGFLGASSTTLDSLSTAKLLSYFAAALYTLPSPYRQQSVDAIATAPGFSAVQNAVIAALQSNPTSLETNTGVTAALSTFVASLYAAANTSAISRQLRAASSLRHRMNVSVNPGTQSGVTTINDFPDGIHFVNTYRRAAEAFIDRDSYVDQTNTRIPSAVQDVLAPQQIAPTSGLSNVTSSLVTAIQGVFTGATQYTPVSTSSVPLANVAGALSTRYIITVVGAGAQNSGVTLRSEETSARHFIEAQQLVQDFVVPIVASILIPLNSAAIDNALAFDGGNAPFTDLITTLTTAAPQIYGLMDSDQVGDALLLAFNTVLTSNTVQAAFFQFVQSGIAGAAGTASAAAFFTGASGLLNKLNLLSGAFVTIDLAVVTAGIAASDAADQFTVDVTGDTVTLVPPTAVVANLGTQTFTAAVPAASLSGQQFVWQWANTATVGHLSDGVSGHTDNFTSNDANVVYSANATGTGTDTITVTAFLVQGSNRVQVGNPRTAIVAVGGPALNLTPSQTIADATTLPLTATLVTAGSPPPGTLTYKWATAGTVGTIDDPVSGAVNNFTTTASTVNYQSTQGASGSDTITVQAILTNGSNSQVLASATTVITVAPTILLLRPHSQSVANSGTGQLQGTVVMGNGSPPPGMLSFTWNNTGTYGHITDPVSGARDSFTTSASNVTYTANATGNGTDTVTLTATQTIGTNVRMLTAAPATVTVGVTPSPSPSPTAAGPGCAVSGGGTCGTATVIGSYDGGPNAGQSIDVTETVTQDASTQNNFGASVPAYFAGTVTIDIPNYYPGQALIDSTYLVTDPTDDACAAGFVAQSGAGGHTFTATFPSNGQAFSLPSNGDRNPIYGCGELIGLSLGSGQFLNFFYGAFPPGTGPPGSFARVRNTIKHR